MRFDTSSAAKIIKRLRFLTVIMIVWFRLINAVFKAVWGSGEE
ncbi:hypothetical protein RMSM_06049 [Rhodopirellula maiorica SM1]|uniref:Uncharacterized protein n=1 Tax=Rhodopirellula maiorica SM1 TaxID=1265738 RepID=M5RCB3_9BACT|nr:hypothetical protein RMSM_06049 [Rhodopirellula maiorica SM1]